MARWRKRFSQLLNLHGVSNIKQREIYTAEPLATKPSALVVELAIEKLKSPKPPDIFQIPEELIKAEGKILRSEIH